MRREDSRSSRILRGVGANAVAQGITLATQLLSLPLFLHFWTLDEYGVWLILSAIPAYFSLADVGVGTVAMNRITMLAARGRHDEAATVFGSALAMTLIATALLFAASLLVIGSFDLAMLHAKAAGDTLAMLIAVALLGAFTPLIDGIFRSAGQFATGTIAINLIRATEWLAGMAGLLLWHSMPAVACGMLLGRLLPSIALVLWSMHLFPQFTWSLRSARIAHIRDMLPAAGAFLALPVGNAILLQGTTIVVGATFGPAVVAVFNSCRTLSRIPVQALTMFSRSLWPEMSRIYGAGDGTALRRLYRRGSRLALAGSAVACTGLFLAAPIVLRVWSHSAIAFDPLVVGLLCVTAFAGCAWQIEQVLLSATNTHIGISLWYILSAVGAVLLAATSPASAGIGPVIGSLLLFEGVMFVVARRAVVYPLRACPA